MTRKKSLQKEEKSLTFSDKEVDFARSLFDRHYNFNGTLLEVNKLRQSFYLGGHLNGNLHLVVYQKFEK